MQKYWDSEEVFLDGDHYFDQLSADIQNATDCITIEMYIFNNDTLGNRIAAQLIEAHQRGVKVQIVVDGVGSYLFFEKLYGIFSKQGINVKMFNPLPFYHPYYGNLTIWKKINILILRLWKLNRRNHRKIITIDQNIMFLGSYNFTSEHTKLFHDKKWKDMGVRVTGEQVKFAVLNFKKIWKLRDYYRYKKQVKHITDQNWRSSPLRVNNSLIMKSHYYKELLRRIHRSKERIWLITPYFIPKRRFIRYLCKAAERGVDVRLLISSKTDVPMFQTLQFFYFPYLLKNGVKIFLYSDTILHAKNFIIDEWITVGSSNLNHRSFLHDLEVDLVIQDEKNIDVIKHNFVETTTEERLVTQESLKQRPLWDQFLSRLFFIFKYWF